jgi:hypothetical protein
MGSIDAAYISLRAMSPNTGTTWVGSVVVRRHSLSGYLSAPPALDLRAGAVDNPCVARPRLALRDRIVLLTRPGHTLLNDVAVPERTGQLGQGWMHRCPAQPQGARVYAVEMAYAGGAEGRWTRAIQRVTLCEGVLWLITGAWPRKAIQSCESCGAAPEEQPLWPAQLA